jgi:hypothetical protein
MGDEAVQVRSDVPHLLHVWREAQRTAMSARRFAELARQAAHHSETAAMAAENAARAATEALVLAGVDIPGTTDEALRQPT